MCLLAISQRDGGPTRVHSITSPEASKLCAQPAQVAPTGVTKGNLLTRFGRIDLGIRAA